MSENLSDLAERHFHKILSLMQKGKSDETFKELEKAEEIAKLLLKDPENEFFQINLQMKFDDIFALGHRLEEIGRFSQAQNFYELSLLTSQKLLKTDAENIVYQSCVGGSLNNLGSLLKTMGRLEDAKDKCERVLDIRQNLLKKDPKNIVYQSDVAMTLNNLGLLLLRMGLIDEAKDNCEKALDMKQKLLKNDPENIIYQSKVGETLNILGILLRDMGRMDDAKDRFEKALDMRQKLLKTDPENIVFQSNVGETLNNLGVLFKDMGLIDEAKDRYEKALEIRQNLLKKDLKNIVYQSKVGETLNNLGILFKDEGNIKEAKQKYERALEIFTEPMQYLTIGMKSSSIIRLIELNIEQAREKTNLVDKTKYRKIAIELCKEYRDFFIKHKLNHERKLVTEAGLSAYIDLSMINVRFEKDSGKRAKQYENALQALEKLGELEDEAGFSILYSSAACYLRGRKLVNEALVSRKPEKELLKLAVEQFRNAKETFNKANVCFSIYTVMFEIQKIVEEFEEIDSSRLKELVQEVIASLPEDICPSVRNSFENDKKVHGGSTGTVSTLNKHLNKRRKEGIVAPISGVMEQFVLIAKINTNYFSGQDTQNAQEAVTDRLIQIFEETELRKNSIDNKGSKPNVEDFIKLLRSIKTCESKTELKNLLEIAQKEFYEIELDGKVQRKSLIEFYSPLMNERIQNMENLSLEKMKKRCRCILIPSN